MATYAIGDIQGCYQSFQKLLNKIQFNPSNDFLWLAGDMINRGPDSLNTMRFILEYQAQIQCVLGNHELHFLAVVNQNKAIHSKDTFNDILLSNQKDDIVNWLSKQPLAFYSRELKTLMVHAGLPSCWSALDAVKYSHEVSSVLQSNQATNFYSTMYGNQPEQWGENLQDMDRLRYITNALTRIRYCYADGRLELQTKSPIGSQVTGLTPWFELDNKHYQENIVFGHWASLNGKCSVARIQALDTGCVWGGKLTALRLEDKQRFSVSNSE